MRKTTKQDYETRILRVLTHIQKHLDEALNLEEFAAIAYFSPFHFHRIFRGMVGEPLISHVRRLRIERAAYQLKFSSQSVTRIAFDAGYETHEAFTRAFSQAFDMPPSTFRKQHLDLVYREIPSTVHYSPDGKVEEIRMKKDIQPLDAEMITMKPVRVAFVRHTGPYNMVGPAWQILMSNPAVLAHVVRAGQAFGLCYDDPDITEAENLRYDACVEVDEQFEAEGEIGVLEFPGGQHAQFRHTGPYDGLYSLYLRAYGEWLPASGREARHAPTVEIYHNTPMNTPPEKLVTDVCIPVED